MDWGALVGPAVVAAVVSGVVTTIGFFVNRSTSLTTHREKLKADQDLAERKVSADIALAERKLTLDRKLADWKRRTEVAEQVLADFYKARDVFSDARRPFALAGEGSSRPKREGETENEAEHRNAIYASYERLLAERDFLSEMHARRFRLMALFGNEAAEPFLTFVQTFNEIGTATGMMLSDRFHGSERLREKHEMLIGWVPSEEDPIKVRLDGAVAKIEALCSPVLRDHPQ